MAVGAALSQEWLGGILRDVDWDLAGESFLKTPRGLRGIFARWNRAR